MVRLGRLSISVPQLLWSRLGLIANAWTEHWRTDLQGWTLQEWTLTEEVCVMLGIDSRFLQRAQCSHCKRCISYSNSVCPSVRPSVRHTPVLCQNDGKQHGTVQFALSDSKMRLVLQKPKNIPQGRPLPPEIFARTDLPPPDSSES